MGDISKRGVVATDLLHIADDCKQLMIAAGELPVSELPRLLGRLREIEATALARLAAPVPAAPCDQLIDVATAAHRLGVSEDYLYRHHAQFPFTRRMGKRLLFSSLVIDRHIKQAR